MSSLDLGKQEATVQNRGKKKKVISTSGMGMQKVVGALHIAKEIWEPTQLGRFWTLVQTGSLCDTSSHFKIDVKGL